MKKRTLFLAIIFILISAQLSPALGITGNSGNAYGKTRRLEALNSATTSGKNRGQEMKDLREDYFASRSALREEFKARLATIKDTRKQQILQKLAVKMNRVNARRVEHWRKILARLTDILNRIKATGKHTTELDAAITNADSKLALATAAVDAQAGKDYTTSIATGSGLKNSVGTAISAEQSDLRNVLKLINDGRKAVMDALRALKVAFGGPLPKLATSSGTPATSSGTPATESGTPATESGTQ